MKTASLPKAEARPRPAQKQARRAVRALLPEPGPSLALPPIVKRRLSALSRHAVRVAWARGMYLLIAAACLLLLAQTGGDWLFDFSQATRMALLGGDLAVFLGILAFHFLRPWLQRLSLEEAALRAEKHWPELRSSVISTVQLARRPDGSRELVGRLIKQVARKLERMDLRAAVDVNGPRRTRWVAFVSVLLLAGLGCIAWPKSKVLLARVALSNEPLPTQTQVEPISGDFKIPAGQTLQLEARAKGVIPRVGRVEIAYPGKPRQAIVVNPKPATPDLFSVPIQNVQQPFAYRFFLGDGRSPEFNVQLVQPPLLESIGFEQRYPAYMGLTATRHSAASLTLMAGSTLHIEGKADRAIKSAAIQLHGLEGQVEMKVGAGGRGLQGDLPIPTAGLNGLSIVLKDAAGIESVDNALYQVSVTPDKAPVIELQDAQAEETSFIVSENPRVRFTVQDDFKVNAVWLCCELPPENGREGAAPEVKKIPIELKTPAASLRFDYVLQNPASVLPWKEGASFSYWIEAADNNDVTGPGVGRTTPRRWSVVSAETKRQETQERLHKYSESLDDLSKTQETIQQNVGNLIKK